MFHPQHNTLVTIGSDGRYSMWDKDARTKLKTSDAAPLPLTCAAIHASGQVMAYAIGYDWSRVSLLARSTGVNEVEHYLTGGTWRLCHTVLLLHSSAELGAKWLGLII